MILEVVMPELGMGAEDARVAVWLKQPGDSIGMGEPICELQIRRWKTVGRAKDASILARRKRRKQESEEPHYTPMACRTCRNRDPEEIVGVCPGCISFTLIASETATMQTHETPVGHHVPVGTVLAQVDSGHDVALPPGTPTPTMRTVLDLLDRTEQAR